MRKLGLAKGSRSKSMMDDSDPRSESPAKKGKMNQYLKLGFEKGKEGITKGALKSQLAVEHAIGLGQTPNVIPPGDAEVTGPPREVWIGWHPVGGVAGTWFAEQTRLGKLITERTKSYPDPTQHWAVLVGDYVHQLWMDERLDIIYTNAKFEPSEWHTFFVGHTTFNDQALYQACEMTIYQMRKKQPSYSLISNNCQNFAVNLLSAIQVGKHRQFGTAFAIYKAATGRGTIKDLFVPDPSDTQQQQDDAVEEEEVDDQGRPLRKQDTVENASIIMDENTKKLDGSHSL